MRPQRLFWQLFLSHALLLLVVMAGVTWLSNRSVQRFYMEETKAGLAAHAQLVAGQVAPLLPDGAYAEVDSLCKAWGSAIGMRITVIRPDGLVLGDSHEDPRLMERHGAADRAEVGQVLQGETGAAIRRSETLRRSMLYVAVPVLQSRQTGDHVAAVVRTALPLSAVQETLRALNIGLLGGSGVLAALLALLSLALARRISRPLEALRDGAERLSRGDFSRRLAQPGLTEARGLAESMDRMAAQLRERLDLVTRQRNELETILRSMTEGILAVDLEQRVVTMNAAAARILSVSAEEAAGRPVHELLRNPPLQALIERALGSAEPVEGDVVLHGEGERHLEVRGAILRDREEREIGALLVLHDVSRLRQLERMRSDFVANVSHELKTPVTAIQGAVETLASGAIADPEAAERFLSILARQAGRTEAIIEDLLRLSRIEEEAGRGGLELEPGSIEMVLAGAVQACQAGAREKGIEIEFDCPPELEARINPPLLENAVANLIDNAVKYSASGGPVRVSAAAHGGEVLITVNDQGCGIDQRFHERIFERFFRVDRSRGRELGGTGLGLAIVKHIVLAHGGRVTVDSAPGRGSTFGIVLPCTTRAARHELADS